MFLATHPNALSASPSTLAEGAVDTICLVLTISVRSDIYRKVTNIMYSMVLWVFQCALSGVYIAYIFRVDARNQRKQVPLSKLHEFTTRKTVLSRVTVFSNRNATYEEYILF